MLKERKHILVRLKKQKTIQKDGHVKNIYIVDR